MRKYPMICLLNPAFFLRHFWRERLLIQQFAKRDFEGRYKGTLLGLFWSLLVPLIMLLVYTFVFSVVFKARWGSTGNQSRAMFAVILFANLLPFNLFNELVASSAGLIIHNANLVKKVVFPLEVLPVSRLLAVCMQSLLSLVILLVAIAAVDTLKWQMLLLPVVLGPLLLFALGVSFVVAALNVFVRDVHQIIGVLLTLLLFLSPIFYPLEAVPERLRVFVALNPLAVVIEQFRAIMIYGAMPAIPIVLVLWAVSVVVALLGFAWFMKAKPSFADVM